MFTRDKILFNYLMIFTCCLALTGCFSAAHPGDAAWSDLKESYRVKGRADFEETHQIGFGPYQSSAVQYDVTETHKRWEIIPVKTALYPRNKNTVGRFNLSGSFGARSEVHYATGIFTNRHSMNWQQFIGYQVGAETIESLPGKMVFSSEIVTGEAGTTWKMMIAPAIENTRACGFLLRDEDNYYNILPILNENDPSTVTGYLFKNRAEQQVAAVHLFDKSAVELGHLPEAEKFLLANAAASILVNYFAQVRL